MPSISRSPAESGPATSAQTVRLNVGSGLGTTRGAHESGPPGGSSDARLRQMIIVSKSIGVVFFRMYVYKIFASLSGVQHWFSVEDRGSIRACVGTACAPKTTARSRLSFHVMVPGAVNPNSRLLLESSSCPACMQTNCLHTVCSSTLVFRHCFVTEALATTAVSDQVMDILKRAFTQQNDKFQNSSGR